MLDKSKLGTALGILSILSVLVSTIFFYIERGPNADIYLGITVFSVLSVIGIILGVVSLWMVKGHKIKSLIGSVGVIANVAVLAVAYLLLLAMGISEP